MKKLIAAILACCLALAACAALAMTLADLPEPADWSGSVDAPSFYMEGVGVTEIDSDDYKGRNMILVYGKIDCYYTRAFLTEIKPAMKLLKQYKVDVLVGLFDDPTDEEITGYVNDFPGIICGAVSDYYDESGLWTGLEAWTGIAPRNVTFPGVFLRDKNDKLRFCSTGPVNNPMSIAAAALAMAGAELPTPTPEPTPTPTPDRVSKVTVNGGIYKLNHSKMTAALTGVKNTSRTSLVIPAVVPANDAVYSVTEIKAKACKDMKNLKTLTIGKNVKTIGKEAFSGCGKLKTITIKTTKLTSKTVGENAFRKVYKKVTFKLPKKKLKAYKQWLPDKGAPAGSKYQAN